MINAEPHDVHIGHAIKERFDTMGFNKSQLGRLIGIPQQHVNRMFERETIDTNRLVAVSRALCFNFFALFTEETTGKPEQISTTQKDVANPVVNVESQINETQMAVLKVKLESALNTEKDLRDQIAQLKASLKDKDSIIELLKEKNRK